jgi:hypothetical protein
VYCREFKAREQSLSHFWPYILKHIHTALWVGNADYRLDLIAAKAVNETQSPIISTLLLHLPDAYDLDVSSRSFPSQFGFAAVIVINLAR